LTSAASVAQAEVDAFIGEIESTGTAFESMRERNQALLNQLTQRDEANASLTSERLRVTTHHTCSSSARWLQESPCEFLPCLTSPHAQQHP